MPDDTPPRPQREEVRLTEPAERQSIELGEHFRKGTDPFPIVNVAADEVQPSVSADPPAGIEPSVGQDE